jgi:hypothetical protein
MHIQPWEHSHRCDNCGADFSTGARIYVEDTRGIAYLCEPCCNLLDVDDPAVTGIVLARASVPVTRFELTVGTVMSVDREHERVSVELGHRLIDGVRHLRSYVPEVGDPVELRFLARLLNEEAEEAHVDDGEWIALWKLSERPKGLN